MGMLVPFYNLILAAKDDDGDDDDDDDDDDRVSPRSHFPTRNENGCDAMGRHLFPTPRVLRIIA
jgi:hypothetical protein